MLIDSAFHPQLTWVLDLASGQLRVSLGLESLLGTPMGTLEDLCVHLEPRSAARLHHWLTDMPEDPEPGEIPLTFTNRQPAVYVAQLEPLFAKSELISVQAQLIPVLATLHEQPASHPHPDHDVCPQGCMGIVLTDPLGRIRECNPVFCHMLGLPRAALLGKKLLNFIHPADRERPVTLYDQLRDGNIETIHVEKRYQQAEGTYFWAEVVITLMREADGEISHCVRYILNLSERRQVDAELAQQQRLNAELASELAKLRQR